METETENTLIAELWYAPLPSPLSFWAWHHWFVVREGAKVDRYEVWQRQDAGGESNGYVYKNLMAADRGVGGGPAVLLFTWHGTEAENIDRILTSAFERYPYRTRYAAFPGPNSNTFVAWVLKVAGLSGDAAILLKRQAVGRGWRSIP